MRWIIDGNNVLGSRPDGWWRDRTGAQVRLIEEVGRWQGAVGEAVAVVLDGHPSDRLGEGARGGVEVRFAHDSRRDAADDAIVALVAAEHDGPEPITVVTADRRLAERVSRRLGAAVEGPRSFLERLAEHPPDEPSGSSA